MLGMIIEAITEKKGAADSRVTTARAQTRTHWTGAEQMGQPPGSGTNDHDPGDRQQRRGLGRTGILCIL